MKPLSQIVCLSLVLLSFACGGEAEPAAAQPASSTEKTVENHFGSEFTLTESIPAKTLFADTAAYAGKKIQVTGRVADVCQKKGCWMVLADGENVMRVLMKDHSFSVAKDITGDSVTIEGTITKKDVDPKDVAHFASESSHPDKMPEKPGVTAVYEMVADGVHLDS